MAGLSKNFKLLYSLEVLEHLCPLWNRYGKWTRNINPSEHYWQTQMLPWPIFQIRSNALNKFLMKSNIFGDVEPCSLVEVCLFSLERSGSMRKPTKQAIKLCLLFTDCLQAYSSTMKIEAACLSETQVYLYQTTRRYFPGDSTLTHSPPWDVEFEVCDWKVWISVFRMFRSNISFQFSGWKSMQRKKPSESDGVNNQETARRYLWKESSLNSLQQGYTCCSLAGEHGSADSWQIASQIRIVLVDSFFKSEVVSRNKKANFPLLIRGRAWRRQKHRLAPTWGPLHTAPLQEAAAATFRCFAEFHFRKLFI